MNHHHIDRRVAPTIWLVRIKRPKRLVGIRIKPVSDMLFSDRYTWAGFSLLGWRLSFVGWRKAGG